LHRLAEKAYLEQTGARSLVSVCERTFREFKYHLPHSTVRNLQVTAELVDSPLQVLERLQQVSTLEQLEDLELQVAKIAERWSEQNGIEIHLQPEAAQLLARKAVDSGTGIEQVFTETFKNYEHGLNLIRKTRGISRFEITPDVIQDPSTTLDSWIRAYYIRQ
jgi:ATP-dependent protease Clp ATPase subunit